MYAARGKDDHAEGLFIKVIESERRVLGESHPDLLLAMSNLGVLYLHQQKYGQAHTLLTTVLDARRRTQSSTHVEIANTLSWLARLSLDQERYGEAEKLAREAETIYGSAWPENWRRYRTQSVLGDTLLGQKRFAEAESILLSAYDGLARREALIPAAERIAVHEAAERMSRLYDASGQRDKAAAWRARQAR